MLPHTLTLHCNRGAVVHLRAELSVLLQDQGSHILHPAKPEGQRTSCMGLATSGSVLACSQRAHEVF